RLLQQACALGRELDAAARAREERYAELIFERADGARKRRLRDMQRLGGAAEMQPLGHRHEIPQLPQIRQIHTARVLHADADGIGHRARRRRRIAGSRRTREWPATTVARSSSPRAWRARPTARCYARSVSA